MPDLIMKGFLGFVLLCSTIQDTFHKKISTWMIVIGAGILCIFIPFCKEVSLINRIMGFLIGVGVVILSKATGGKIGLGDGLLLCVTGLTLGFWDNLELFAAALFAAAVVSILLLVFRLADRKQSIPFIPFLLFGYIILLCANL